jgi:phospholipid transport system substrate-binding protein
MFVIVLLERHRRNVAVALAGAIAIVALLGADVAAAGQATEAVRSTINDVIRILQDEEMKKPARADERRKLLERVIGDRFSYEEMSKRSLGAHWNKLSPAERQEFVQLFQQLLSGSYAGKVEGYSGEQVSYVNERLQDGYAEVRTKIVSGKSEIPLDYRMLQIDGNWRVYDVVVDGVSLVSNYRGQFAKILRNSSYADLVEKLRKKPDDFKKPDSGKAP